MTPGEIPVSRVEWKGAVRIIFSEPQRGYAWIRAGNTAFAGASALDVMLGGELTDIMRVRRYLDAERGGW